MKFLDHYTDRILFYAQNPHLLQWRKYHSDPKAYKTYQYTWLQKFCFKTILDIGANEGQAAILFRQAFRQATIHSFEPLPDCFTKLKQTAAKLGHVTPYNTALGTTSGTIQFERNLYSPSSSILAVNKTHQENFPQTSGTVSVEVCIQRLDEVMADIPVDGPMLVKLDVQGYERQVIEGGTETLSRADVVIAETSMEPLYDGQPLFLDIVNSLKELGFRYAGSMDSLYSPKDGRVLQQDAFFVR